MIARVRVIMMQKNEGDALARWLSHYGALFGPAALTVLDNGSDDPLTVRLLDAAERSGVTVMRQFVTPHDYRQKGGHFGNIIKSWDHDHAYDFALPLDCDEILAVFTQDGLSVVPQDIHKEFDRLLGTRRALRLDMLLFNIPERPGWFAPVRHFHKGFVPAKSLHQLDNGQHDPSTSLEPGHHSTRFTYLHWHNLSHEETVSRARTKLKGYVDLEDREALLAYEKKPGVPSSHAVAIVLRTREEFLEVFKDEVRVFVDGAGGRNLIEAGDRLFVWDAGRYLARNRDVAEHYDLTALNHYLRFGFREGRETE